MTRYLEVGENAPDQPALKVKSRVMLYGYDGGSLAMKARETAMPIYEYHCLVCNRDFEKLVMTSTAEVECTNCGSELLEKKFSLFGSKVGERAGSFGPSGGEGGGSCGCGSCTCH
jgi:putative FmdB family regulatory protein